MEENPQHGSLVAGVREAYESGKTKELEWRKAQLGGLIRMITEEEDAIFDALHDDLGKHRVESFRDEIGVLLKSFRNTLQNLKKWASPEKAHVPLISFPCNALVVQEPIGVVLIFSCWNLPLGNARVGRIIMTKAAKHLTPLALELGSKCPCIVDCLDSKRECQVAVNRIIGAKWSTCGGQACVAIDYILVEEQFAPFLIELLKCTLKRFFTKPEYMTRILNEKHFHRLRNLLEDDQVKSSIVHGGNADPKTLWIEPTIVLNPPLDSDIMMEEIFGPLLPIITVKKTEDCIAFLKSKPKPLAIYAFTNDEKLKQRIVAETSSGSVAFNDAIVQYGLDSVPFGGIGQSGFGQYHGKYSFKLFSHRKAVLRRSLLVEFMFRYPPWDEYKMGMLRRVFRYDYVSLVLALLGIRR